jgi:hypothetical protein
MVDRHHSHEVKPSIQSLYLPPLVQSGQVLKRPLSLLKKLKVFGVSLANTLALLISLSRPLTKRRTNQKRSNSLPRKMHLAMTPRKHSIFLKQKTS